MKPFISIILILLMTGCLHKPDNKSVSKPATQPDLIEMNRSYINKDRETISDYIARSSHKFNETGTGLWYSMIEKGEGAIVMTGNNVTYDYNCTLLNGDTCYSGTKTLRVGYAGAESGVTEGLQMMRQGSDFLFIIPPYLAYGLTGDGNRIPGRSILLYRIRIKGIN
jgi:FKBP-type peptidyl-prolyl cis-trans isomerase FkpA